jgi:hypothetical protein
MSDEFDDVVEPGAVAAARQQGRRAALPIPELIADVYAHAATGFRARLIECLLRPVGPLALVTIAAGTFGAFLHRSRQQPLAVSLEDAARVSAEHMLELARYVEQLSPDTFQQIGSLLADNPLTTASVSGSLLLLALSRWRRRA